MSNKLTDILNKHLSTYVAPGVIASLAAEIGPLVNPAVNSISQQKIDFRISYIDTTGGSSDLVLSAINDIDAWLTFKEMKPGCHPYKINEII